MNILRLIGGALGLLGGEKIPSLKESEPKPAFMRMRDGHSGSRDSKRQERARAKAKRGKTARRLQRRLERERS